MLFHSWLYELLMLKGWIIIYGLCANVMRCRMEECSASCIRHSPCCYGRAETAPPQTHTHTMNSSFERDCVDGTYPQLSTPVRAHGVTPLWLLPCASWHPPQDAAAAHHTYPLSHNLLSACSSLSWMDGERKGGAKSEHAQCVRLEEKKGCDGIRVAAVDPPLKISQTN